MGHGYIVRHGGVSGGLKMELLWTNASPASSFVGQDIALDLSDYDGVFIIFALTISNNYRPNPLFVFEKDTGRSYTILAEQGNKMGIRSVIMYSNKVNFGDAKSVNTYGSSSGNATNNDVLRPYKIYGIKGVA